MNKEERIAYDANYYVAHREERRTQDATYHAEHREELHGYHLKAKYGLSLEDYTALLEKQGGRCAVCGTPPDGRRLSVDHNHETGEVRGLLCLNCNTTLGKVGDSPEILMEAIAYLQGDTT